MAKSNKQQSEQVQATTRSGLHAKVLGLMQAMQGAFYERDDEVRAITAAILARQHVFLLGPPGTAKSLLMEAFTGAVEDAKYFETLCMKTSPPEQFFGPLSIMGLQQDRYERKVQGYLPDANLAVVDEVFKCNAAVLNGLLRIMNERKYSNGSQTIHVPLVSILGASNELAQEDDLVALYDRFLVRLNVRYIQEQGNVVKLLTVPTPDVGVHLTFTELLAAIKEVAAVEVPVSVAAAAVALREQVLAEGMRCSDRRIKQAMNLVRAYAWLGGRSKANTGDLAVLAHVFWENETQIPKAFDIVMDVTNPSARKGRELIGGIRKVLSEVTKAKEEDQLDVAGEALSKVNEGMAEIKKLIKLGRADGNDVSALEGYLATAKREAAQLYQKHIGSKMKHITAPDDDEED